MTVWNHRRKGRITGEIVADNGEFVDIRLATDHELKYTSTSNRRQTDEAGEVITVRTDMLTKLED